LEYLSFEFTLHHNFSKTCKHVYFLVSNEGRLVLILSKHEHSSRNAIVFKGNIKSIVNTTQKYSSIIIHVRYHPLPNFREVFFFEIFDEIIYGNIRKSSKDASINLSTYRITLALIQDTTPIREVLVD